MQLSSVVLPEPLGPMSPTTWPGKTSMLMSRSASTRASPAPKCLERCSTRTTGWRSPQPWLHPDAESAAAGSILSARRTPRLLAARQTATVMANTTATSSGQDDEPSRKITLKGQDKRQPDSEADDSHRQRLLDDQADDGPIGRADELERGDRSQLVHGQSIDDQRNDDRRHDHQQHQNHQLLPALISR